MHFQNARVRLLVSRDLVLQAAGVAEGLRRSRYPRANTTPTQVVWLDVRQIVQVEADSVAGFFGVGLVVFQQEVVLKGLLATSAISVRLGRVQVLKHGIFVFKVAL